MGQSGHGKSRGLGFPKEKEKKINWKLFFTTEYYHQARG